MDLVVLQEADKAQTRKPSKLILPLVGLIAVLQGCGTTPSVESASLHEPAPIANFSAQISTQLDSEIEAVTATLGTEADANQRQVTVASKAPIAKFVTADLANVEDDQSSLDTHAPTVWAAISDRMHLAHYESSDRIEQEKQRYLNMRYHLLKTAERARPYLHYIASEVARRELPLELALLPAIESAFDPYAYSSGHAAGLWQFVPRTATWLGMENNWWYDDRRDVVASTHTALDYLTDLNRRFKGDWLHTLAAYNAGATTVHRAIAKNKRAGLPTDFWSLSLPKETRHYVPRLLALSKIVQDREQLAVEFPEIPNAPYFVSVAAEGQFELADAASLSGVQIEDFYRLNPGFNRQVSAPDQQHRLLLPIDAADQFAASLDRLYAKQGKWVRYEVGQSDNLRLLAMRYSTSVAAIRIMNGVNRPMVRPGEILLIKQSDQRTADNGASLASTGGAENRATTLRILHTASEGESLKTIAKAYDLSVGTLARWNGIGMNSRLIPGKKLVIWMSINPQLAQNQVDNSATGLTI